jgi:hypothetical protein
MGSDLGISKQGTEGTRIAIDETPETGKIELRRVACHMTESLFKRLLRRIFPDQRKTDRHLQPPLVGYLGTMSASRPFEVADISPAGFCLLTGERWAPGTEMPITLERTALPEGKGAESFTVQATVVRCGENGVGFSIVLCEDDSKTVCGNSLRVRWMTRPEMERFLQALKEPEVQEGIEPSGVSAKNTGIQAGSRLNAAFNSGD